MKMTYIAAIVAGLLLESTQVSANSLVAPGPRTGIAKSSIAAAPVGEWNRLSHVGGPNLEVWTRDGDKLNSISFFGGIGSGQTLYRERNKKEMPLPKVDGNMLLPDIPVLFESTYRSQYSVDRMTIDSQESATVGGKQGIRFTYSYVRGEDEVERRGEAVATIDKKKLYLVNYEAPSIYFFAKDLASFHQIVETLKF